MDRSFEERLADIERQVAELRAAYRAASAPHATEYAVARTPRVPPVRQNVPVKRAPREPITLERLLGGRVLLIAGAIAFFLGVAFFIKYSIDAGWLGPSARVALGLIVGVALFAVSEWMRNKTHRFFAESVSGLGAGILYLSLWGAGSALHLVSLGVAFTGMAVVTAATFTVAVRQRSETLAFVALIGGMITPLLNQTPQPNVNALFVYLAILDAGVIAAVDRRWKRVELTALVATQIYLVTAMPPNAAWDAQHTTVLAFATFFFALFSALPFYRLVRIPVADVFDYVMVALAAGAYASMLYALAAERSPYAVAAAYIALAAVYVALARLAGERSRVFACCVALSLLTLALPVALKEATLADAWCAEAVLLVIAGARTKITAVRIFGYGALMLGALGVVADFGTSASPPFANDLFVSRIILAIAFAITAVVLSRAEVDANERRLCAVAEVCAVFFGVYGFGAEIFAATHESQIALSIFMIAVALVLVSVGFALKRPLARYEGLTLFAVALLKAFLVDLTAVEPIVRIVSFLAVGGVLLAVALAYQRLQNPSEAG